MEHLEGRQSVLAALKAGRRKFQAVLISHGAHLDKLQDILDVAAERGVPVRQADSKELDALAHGATHGGVLAVCTPKPRSTPDELFELMDRLNEPPLLLLLEGVEDARNLGFTLRSAEALGVHAVMIKKHLWDLDSVEIARPSSGAYERLTLVQFEDVDVLRQLQGRGLCLYGCVAGAKRRIYEADLARPAILAIGGERRGLSGAVRSICDRFVSIPTVGEATSLSLSHASAIIMAEAMRQRLRPPAAEQEEEPTT
jgi:23S rRNA (guanosine2251-2'-O)-methyltransferase